MGKFKRLISDSAVTAGLGVAGGVAITRIVDGGNVLGAIVAGVVIGLIIGVVIKMITAGKKN